MAPAACQAAGVRGKASRKVQAFADGLRAALALFFFGKIADQESRQQAVARRHGVHHVGNRFDALHIELVAVKGNAALIAAGRTHELGPQGRHFFQLFIRLFLCDIAAGHERIIHQRGNALVVFVCGIIGKIKADGHAGGLDFRQLALGKAIVARVHQIEALHILDGKAIQRIQHIAADAALVGTKENAVAIFGVHCHARGTVFPNHLFALHQFHALFLQGGNDVLGLFVRAKDAHVGAA